MMEFIIKALTKTIEMTINVFKDLQDTKRPRFKGNKIIYMNGLFVMHEDRDGKLYDGHNHFISRLYFENIKENKYILSGYDIDYPDVEIENKLYKVEVVYKDRMIVINPNGEICKIDLLYPGHDCNIKENEVHKYKKEQVFNIGKR